MLTMTENLQTPVFVTPANIAAGVPNNCERCPVALALIDALGAEDGTALDVELDWVYLTLADGTVWRAATDRHTEYFIRCFDDHGGAGGPFAFTLIWHRDLS